MLDILLVGVTYLGALYVWIAVVLGLWFKKRRREAVLLLIGLVAGGLTVLSLKYLIRRPPPSAIISGSRVLVGNNLLDAPSFPSGHTERFFAAATILGHKMSRWKLPLYITALLVGFSRIYVGVHWPTDVFFGAILGQVIGMIVLKFEGEIIKFSTNRGLLKL